MRIQPPPPNWWCGVRKSEGWPSPSLKTTSVRSRNPSISRWRERDGPLGTRWPFSKVMKHWGGDEPNAFWRKRSCFGCCWYCWHYHPKNNQKHPKKLVLVFRLAGFCEGSDTLHPESIWCFWKIVVTKAAVYEIPAGMLVDFKLRSYLGPQVFTQTHQM